MKHTYEAHYEGCSYSGVPEPHVVVTATIYDGLKPSLGRKVHSHINMTSAKRLIMRLAEYMGSSMTGGYNEYQRKKDAVAFLRSLADRLDIEAEALPEITRRMGHR